MLAGNSARMSFVNWSISDLSLAYKCRIKWISAESKLGSAPSHHSSGEELPVKPADPDGSGFFPPDWMNSSGKLFRLKCPALAARKIWPFKIVGATESAFSPL